jgi:predicted secreted protein
MAAASGNLAKFYYRAAGGAITASDLVGDVAGISDVSISGAIIDVSTIGANAFREFIGGKYSMTFTIEVVWSFAAHTAIMADLLDRTTGTFEIDFQNGQVTGTALVTNAQISAQQDDAVRSTLSFQTTGAVTIAATAAGP